MGGGCAFRCAGMDSDGISWLRRVRQGQRWQEPLLVYLVHILQIGTTPATPRSSVMTAVARRPADQRLGDIRRGKEKVSGKNGIKLSLNLRFQLSLAEDVAGFRHQRERFGAAFFLTRFDAVRTKRVDHKVG